jgi:hypothetical protein
MTRLIAAALFLNLAAACGGGSDQPAAPTPDGNAEWTGTVVGAGGSTGSGWVSLTFSQPVSAVTLQPEAALAATAITVSGALKLGGGPTVALTGGTYDPASHAFAGLAGSAYTLSGTVGTSGVAGQIAGPIPGQFVALAGPVASTPVYCGTFHFTVPAATFQDGAWNLVLTGSAAAGKTYDPNGPNGGDYGTVAGTVTGSTVSLQFPNFQGGTGTAVGTISGTNASGTWSNNATPSAASGTWSGVKCN